MFLSPKIMCLEGRYPMVMENNRVHPFVVYFAIVSLFSCFAMLKKKKKKKEEKVVVAVLLHLICVIQFSLECYKLPLLGAKRSYGYLNEVVHTYYFDECHKLYAIIESQNFTHIFI